jgi:hypothetical protein
MPEGVVARLINSVLEVLVVLAGVAMEQYTHPEPLL